MNGISTHDTLFSVNRLVCRRAVNVWTTTTKPSMLGWRRIALSWRCGRAHIIPEGSDGSGADHKGQVQLAFLRLGRWPTARRTARFQIRQMGTLPTHQRKGHAAAVLGELERIMTTNMNAKPAYCKPVNTPSRSTNHRAGRH